MEIKIPVTKKSVAKTSIVCFLLFSAFFAGATFTVPTAYKQGYNKGYENALDYVKEALSQKGIVINWENLGNGKYELSVYLGGQLIARAVPEVHLWIEHYRNGKLLTKEFGAGVLTTVGQDWIEKMLSGTLNSSQRALYCSDSNDATDPPLDSWNVLPSEITTNGLDRQTGTYANTGVGTWNVTCTKSVTGTQSTQLWGLNWDSNDDTQALIAGDSGPAQKNCVSGDTLKETWQVSVTQGA